jgi:hypothetical protein
MQAVLPGQIRPAISPTITKGTLNTPLDYALWYYELGYAVIPVRYMDKVPTLTGWQSKRLDEQGVRVAFDGARLNIGVVLGEASGGTVDIDADCPEAISLASRFLPKTECVFGRASAPRSHHVYRVSEPGPRKVFEGCGNDGMLVEYRGEQ